MKAAPATAGVMALGLWMALSLLFSGCATRTPEGLFRRTARQHGEQACFLRGLPAGEAAGPQNEWGALADVLRYWNQPAAPRELAAKHTDLPRGTAAYFTRAASEAHQRDLWVSASSLPMDALKVRLKAGVPLMVPLQDRLLDFESRRYVVVAGFDDVAQQVFVYDGTPHGAIHDYAFFLKKWSVQRFASLLIAPPSKAAWDLSGAELLSRADFYYDRGHWEPALADYRRAGEKDYDRASAWIGEGNVWRAQGDPIPAEQAYRKAIQADPHNSSGYNNLAYLLAEQSSRLDEAIALARQAVALDAASPYPYDTLGYSLYKKGSYKEAGDVFEKARARARQHPLAVREEIASHLIQNYLASGDLHLAREVLDDLRRNNPAFAMPQDWQAIIQ